MPEPARSMDEVDRASFRAGPGPFAATATRISLEPGDAVRPCVTRSVSLDGEWDLAPDAPLAERLSTVWAGSVAAVVPGSIHSALVAAGVIPDPTVGKNDAAARDASFKCWWYRKTFDRPAGLAAPRLVFDGVAVQCEVWLNGRYLGSHEGMFGGPEFDIAEHLQDQNTLMVRLAPAPYEYGEPKHLSGWMSAMNVGWASTVVFNNVYGWHYANIPALGIWRSVRIEGQPAVRIRHPFAATRDLATGLVSLNVQLVSTTTTTRGTLRLSLEPLNFTGQVLQASHRVDLQQSNPTLHLLFHIPDGKAWWPVDLGEPNLYRIQLSFTPDDDGVADHVAFNFGLRTIEMAPLPGGPTPDKYNWTFVINGRPTFIKGTGWCTPDALMDFSRERYERFLLMARDEHCQMVRAWGGGMPETDDFYDLCDRLGIMVMQEWPTAWNSHESQPYKLLEETVRLNTLRLRNHPSLVMWGGGNESSKPSGAAIDMMGRYSIELDGTRPFHRGEPWGGSRHFYPLWWGEFDIDEQLKIAAPFIGEFGNASLPMMESVQRYLPAEEQKQWPPSEHRSFAHHTPVFNTKKDMARLRQAACYFTAGRTMEDFIWGTQLAQVVSMRHAMEAARTRWPECTGSLLYKLNDNFPAASWSTVDWYGAAKIAHYFLQDVFAPLHACVLFDSVRQYDKAVELPVFLLDDADKLSDADWQVNVRAYNAKLQCVQTQSFEGRGAAGPVKRLGHLALTAEQTRTNPLLIVAEVKREGRLANRSFYFLNTDTAPDCLKQLPQTTLSLAVRDGKATVRNTDELPAVAAAVLRRGQLDTFTARDNYFWLEPGESHTIDVSHTDGLTAEAWNAASIKP